MLLGVIWIKVTDCAFVPSLNPNFSHRFSISQPASKSCLPPLLHPLPPLPHPGEPPSTDAAGFDKDEQLARVFAEKAARKGLPSAEFAMGYYCAVGIAGVKDVEEARLWASRVAAGSGQQCICRRASALTEFTGTENCSAPCHKNDDVNTGSFFAFAKCM